MLDLVSIEDEVRNTVRVLEYPYGDEKEERALDVAEKLEYPVYEVVTEGASEIEEDIVEDVEAAIESEAIAEELVVEGDGLEDETEPIIELQEPMVDVSEALVDVVPNVMEDEVDDVPAIDTEVTVENKEGFVTYDRFKSMTPEEKADTFRFRRMRSFNTVHNLVSLFFYDIDHIADTNEIMEEAQLVYKGKRNNFIKQRIGEMWRQSIPWSFLICVSQIR